LQILGGKVEHILSAGIDDLVVELIVKKCRGQHSPVARKPLLYTGIEADALFRFQGRIIRERQFEAIRRPDTRPETSVNSRYAEQPSRIGLMRQKRCRNPGIYLHNPARRYQGPLCA
jgi:hypothetical protein